MASYKYAGVLLASNEDGSFLLGKRTHNGKYCSLGGRRGEGEAPKETAIRELREEVGRENLEPFSLREVDQSNRYHLFVGFIPEKFEPSPDSPHDREHTDFRWLKPNQIVNNKEKLHPPFRQAVERLDLRFFAKEAKQKSKIDENLDKVLKEFQDTGEIKRVRKKNTAKTVKYFFPYEKFEHLADALDGDIIENGESIIESPHVYEVGGELQEQQDDDEKSPAEKYDDLDLNARPQTIDKSVSKAAEEIEEWPERGWVVEVPKDALSSIKSLVRTFRQQDPEKFEEAKKWYWKLNGVVDDIADNEAEKVILGILMSVASIRTGFLENMHDAALFFAAVKHDLEEGNGGLLLDYLSEDEKQALKKYLDLREKWQDEREKWQKRKKIPTLNTNYPYPQAVGRGRHPMPSDYSDLLNRDRSKGYRELAFYFLVNFAGIGLLGSKMGGKIYNLVELAIHKGDDLSIEHVIDEMQEYLDFTQKSIYGLRPKAKKDHFLRGMKVSNFALNILQPDYADDRMERLNVTIDTWMFKALYPSLDDENDTAAGEAMSGDPFAYTYLAEQVARMAQQFDLLPHEMQAIIWVLTKKEDEDASVSTIKETEETMDTILKNLGLIDRKAREVLKLSESMQVIIDRFDDLRDFKLLKDEGFRSEFLRMRGNKQFGITTTVQDKEEDG